MLSKSTMFVFVIGTHQVIGHTKAGMSKESMHQTLDTFVIRSLQTFAITYCSSCNTFG